MTARLARLLEREPTLVSSIVRQFLVVLTGFGLKLSGEQVAMLVVLVELLTLAYQRSSTTPIAAPHLDAGTPVTILPTSESKPGAEPQVVTLPQPGVPPVAKPE